MKRRNNQDSDEGDDDRGATAAAAIDVDAVTELTYRRLHHPGRFESVSREDAEETPEQRLARIVHSNRDFTSEDYDTLLLLDSLDTNKAAKSDVRRVAMPCDDVLLKDDGSVKTVFKDASDCESCAVCLDGFEAGQCVQQLPECKHVFHARCITRWFEECGSKPVCPICRVSHPTTEVSATADDKRSEKEEVSAAEEHEVICCDSEDDDGEHEEDDDGDDSDDDVVVLGVSEPPKKKKKRGHHGKRKHERSKPKLKKDTGRDGHPHRHESRQQRSAHCSSWVKLAPGVHASFGPQTTLHAAFKALGKANAPLAHILPKKPPP